MTVAIPQVANTNTFYFWKTQTNLLANAMSTVAVTTVPGSTDGSKAPGNAEITGSFKALGLIANTLTLTSTATVKGVIANSSLGTAGQVLTTNGTTTYWSTAVGTVTQVNTSAGLTGGPINSTGTIGLDLYIGDNALNTSYPVGSTIAVYTGIGGIRAINSSTTNIYVNNDGFNLSGGTASLAGTWKNRGLCGTDYRSPTETRYYYLYQRVA